MAIYEILDNGRLTGMIIEASCEEEAWKKVEKTRLWAKNKKISLVEC